MEREIRSLQELQSKVRDGYVLRVEDAEVHSKSFFDPREQARAERKGLGSADEQAPLSPILKLNTAHRHSPFAFETEMRHNMDRPE